jgi:lipid II:glycine glycyltransferase (peptidoglycan interpeptide bridge formation enzyme)
VASTDDIRLNLTDLEWDKALSDLGGHPLQSALWGSARARVDDQKDHRIAVCVQGVPVMLARVEERRLPLGFKIAWIPRGPVGSMPNDTFCELLKKKGFSLVVSNGDHNIGKRLAGADAFSGIVDLTVGEETLLNGFHKEWRYGVRRAFRDEVTVENSTDVNAFFSLYEKTAAAKDFPIVGSRALMALLIDSKSSPASGAELFLARVRGEVAAGAIVLHIGRSLHYFWGAMDRRFSSNRPSELLHWEIMKWGAGRGFSRYDLEGMDREGNPGVYQFKKRMCGVEVKLPGTFSKPLSLTGHMLQPALSLRRPT